MEDEYRLKMWTIYDHPRDLPGHFIARLFVMEGNAMQATTSVIQSVDLDLIRQEMMNMGLVCLARSPEDDPVIVETWI